MKTQTVAAFAAALAAAVGVLVSQPFTGPWWTYADADATYTGSSLNLTAGGHTKYFDHPGLPLQEAGATGFAVWHAVDGSHESTRAFAAGMLLHLDRARPLFRGLAFAIYLLCTAAAFLVASRALGGPWWGLAGALLWLAAPGLVPMSIQFRPDVLLSGLVLGCGFLIARGYERRSPVHLLAAAGLCGFALTVKLHAVGVLPSLFLASFLAGPFRDWREALLRGVRARRVAIAVVAAGWLALAAYFDVSRIPFHPSVKGIAILLAGVAAAACWALVGRLGRGAVASSFNGVLVAAFVLGVFVPVAIVLDDGLASLPWVADALLGRGVNGGVQHFSDAGAFLRQPLLEALLVWLLAAVAAALGARRRDWSPLLWFLASTLLAVLALERLGATHYFAPAYVLAIVPALGLARRLGRAAPLAAIALVLLVTVPQVSYVDDARASVPVAAVDDTQHALARTLPPGTVALTDPAARLPDTLYASLVAAYVRWMPPYPYSTLPATPQAAWIMRVEHLKPRLYLSATLLDPGARVTLSAWQVDPRTKRRLGSYYAYRLAAGPGVDGPLPDTPPAGAPEISATGARARRDSGRRAAARAAPAGAPRRGRPAAPGAAARAAW